MEKEKATITLSIASRLARLQPLPGQDPSRVFGVVSEGLPQPENGLGYLVECSGHRTVRILAWIQRGVSLWQTDAPLASVPDRAADLVFLRNDDTAYRGVVRLNKSGDVDMATWTSTRGTPRYSLDLSARYLGPYATDEPTLNVRTLSAVAWILLMIVRPAFVDVLGMAGDLSSLSRIPLPDALDLLVRTKGMPAFRHYIARDLTHARSFEVRRICATHKVDGVYLQSTRLFWMRFDSDEVPLEDQRVLLAVEAAINRAILAASWLLEQDLGPRRLDPALWAHAQRHACYGVLRQIPSAFEASNESNPRRRLFGAKATRGGEWDVRTRVASALESLRLPTRLDARFDCDVARGVFALEFAVPGELSLPDPDTLDNILEHPAFTVEGIRQAYALRLALLLAVVGFGASVGITHARVRGFGESLEGDPYLTLDVDRMDFAAGALPTIRRYGPLPSIDDPDDLLRAFELSGAVKWGDTEAITTPLGLAERHQGVAKDKTKLSPRLAGLLRADYAYELDVYGSTGDPRLKEEAHLLEENDDSPLIAIMELEGILASIDDEVGEGRLPLYCTNGTDRLLVSLAPGDKNTRYTTIRDATYAAKVQLSRLYLRLDDVIRALEGAEECVRLAPTAASAEIGFADLYARLDRFDEAKDHLIRALTLVLTTQETAYVFYRLAFAWWRLGEVELATCAYVLAAQDETVHEQSAQELAQLEAQNPGIAEPTVEEAKAQLTGHGIPYPIARPTLEVLAKACLGLVDEGIFDPSWQGLLVLVPETGSDALAQVLTSLRTGTPRNA